MYTRSTHRLAFNEGDPETGTCRMQRCGAPARPSPNNHHMFFRHNRSTLELRRQNYTTNQ